MLQTLDLGRQVAFVQCARNDKAVAFKEQIEKKVNELNGSYRILYSDETGYVTKEDLAPFIKENTEIYICGPAPFMEAVISIGRDLGVPGEHIHFEFFGPALSLESLANAN